MAGLVPAIHAFMTVLKKAWMPGTGPGMTNWLPVMAQAQRTPVSATVPNDLEPYWMPFTANRAFKARPRLIARAKDMFYFTPDGRKLIDGSAGLWCTNAGHNRDPIVEAIQAQAAELDYAPAFQFGHPKAFELAARVAALAPGDLGRPTVGQPARQAGFEFLRLFGLVGHVAPTYQSIEPR